MLEVFDASGLVTFQDSGRHGWQRFGVPTSGPMDWFALQAANLLVSNSPDATVIEIGLGEATFRARRDCVLAVTGSGFEVFTYIWTFPLWTSFFVRAGWQVHIKKKRGGNWACLAIAGGFDVEPMLGSSATYLRGGLGRVIQPGDILKTEKPARDLEQIAARTILPEKQVSYTQAPIIEVIAGLQKEGFSEEGVETFLNNEYTLSTSFDRMGYRLEGAPITRHPSAELISEGMTMGSIQVPTNGQPIVMMADGPTTGGYPKIANVIRADLPLLAQCEPETSKIHFRETTVEQAHEKYRGMIARLNSGIDSEDDE